MQSAFAWEMNAEQTENVSVWVEPFKSQLLKWVGNKQRFAHEIISFFPDSFGTYFEPFLGSAAVLGTLAPRRAEASDCFGPLIGIWATLQSDPAAVIDWYSDRWNMSRKLGGKEAYLAIRDSYNRQANPADLLYLCRACYGGVVRFRKKDGYMSTPCGVHKPISPASFSRRAEEWHRRIGGTQFFKRDFVVAFERAKPGDLVYCDPPYSDSQAILYGAQSFTLDRLIDAIASAKRRGVYVALSLDGSKKSGTKFIDFKFPHGLFEREVGVNVGRSMLRRFQMPGETLEHEVVSDRLLLTY